MSPLRMPGEMGSGLARFTRAPERRRARILDCFVAFAPRNDVKICCRVLAAQSARVVKIHPPRRAWGMPGVQFARSLACEMKSTRDSHHRSADTFRHSRTRMVLTVSFVLPGDRAFLPPLPCGSSSAKRDAGVEASGPHDFTVRDRRIRLMRWSRPSHPAPTSVTIAKRPLESGRDERLDKAASSKTRSEIFFAGGLDSWANQSATKGYSHRPRRISDASIRIDPRSRL